MQQRHPKMLPLCTYSRPLTDSPCPPRFQSMPDGLPLCPGRRLTLTPAVTLQRSSGGELKRRLPSSSVLKHESQITRLTVKELRSDLRVHSMPQSTALPNASVRSRL